MRPILLALSLVLTAAATSGCQVLTTAQGEFDPGVRNQGYWDDGAGNYDANEDYTAEFAGHVTKRSFFTFDLSSACEADAVALQVSRKGQYGSGSFADSISYELFDVTTPASTLNDNTGTNAAIWGDVGSGTSFGHYDIATGNPDDVLALRLNAAGVDAFNAARGGYFSVGGSGPSPAPPRPTRCSAASRALRARSNSP